jgi:hypothetical protein
LALSGQFPVPDPWFIKGKSAGAGEEHSRCDGGIECMGVNRYLILKYNEGKTMKERFLEVTADADQNQEAHPTDKRCDPA